MKLQTPKKSIQDQFPQKNGALVPGMYKTMSNKGIIYLPTSAGFPPSTVSLLCSVMSLHFRSPNGHFLFEKFSRLEKKHEQFGPGDFGPGCYWAFWL